MPRPASRPVRAATALLAATVLGASLAACGGRAEEPATGAEDPTTPAASAGTTAEPGEAATSDEPSEPAEPEGTVIEVVVEDGRATPLGERVPVEVGEPITFRIRSDATDELHVHTSPEDTYFDFGPGRSTFDLVVERPGVVEVELHELGTVLVQLEAR